MLNKFIDHLNGYQLLKTRPIAIMASGERGIDAPSHKECFGRGGSGPVAALFGEDYMKFVNKPTAVEARFEAGGAARPRRFI
jgi:hypothetical protein